MKKIFLLVLLLPFLHYGCMTKSHPKKVKTIDSLISVYDTVEKVLSSIDTMEVKKVMKEYSTNIGLIKKYFNDKKDSTWKVITTYGVIKRPLKDFIRDYPSFYKEIIFSKKQLDTMKADVKANKFEKSKMELFIKDETEAANKLHEQINIAVKGTKENIKLFDSLNPRVIRVIAKLKKSGKAIISKKTSEGEDD